MAPRRWHMLKCHRTILITLLIYCQNFTRAQNHSSTGILVACSLNTITTIQPLNGWTYQGCYRDDHSRRLLNSANSSSTNNTVATCADFCSIGGHTFFGVEFSFQCFCGDTLNSTATHSLSDPSSCDYACCADSSVSCGGFNHISIYEAIRPPPTPSTNATIVDGNSFETSSKARATSDGGGKISLSDKIALGTGVAFGVPMFILAAVTLGMKLFNKSRKDRIDVSSRRTVRLSEIRSIDATELQKFP